MANPAKVAPTTGAIGKSVLEWSPSTSDSDSGFSYPIGVY